MKQTIAWIGSINQQEDILGKLAEHYRVLLAKKEDSAISALSQGLQSEVEIIDCVKNGCWEADIIVVTEGEKREDLFGKILEVAPKKIVLVMNTTKLRDILLFFCRSKSPRSLIEHQIE